MAVRYALALLALPALLPTWAAAFPGSSASSEAAAPPSIIDGHADFAIHYLNRGWSAEAYNIDADFPGQAGVMRWKAGGVDGVVTTVGSDLKPGTTGHFPRVLASLDWFDALVARHPKTLVAARTPADFEAARRAGKIALMPAIEGGDQLDGSLANLSSAYQRGGPLYPHCLRS